LANGSDSAVRLSHNFGTSKSVVTKNANANTAQNRSAASIASSRLDEMKGIVTSSKATIKMMTESDVSFSR